MILMVSRLMDAESRGFLKQLMMKHIEPSCLKPAIFPLVNRNRAGRLIVLLELLQEILKAGVFESILMEVGRQRFRERFLAHQVHKLFHGRRTLGVGNPIEDGLSHMGIFDLGSDGMSGDELIFRVAPCLAAEEGCHSRLVVNSRNLGFNFLKAEVADIFCETLIEPQIIPPAHGDQIAKPMVGEFVDNCIAETQHPLCRDRILEDIQVIESDDASIFHGAPFVLVSKHLVVFGKWIWIPEVTFEELHRLAGHLFNKWSLFHHVRIQRLDAVEIHGDVLVGGRARVLLIWANHETVKIGWQQFSLTKSCCLIALRDSIVFLQDFLSKGTG